MRNIIVIAYQLHYSMGSECAVAWDYIKHMSRNNMLTVLYGSSGEHHQIGNTADMEEYTAEHPMNNVSFIPVQPSVKSKYWDYSLKGIREFYKEYRLWHEDVYRLVEILIKQNKYDIIHFLGPIGYHEPGLLYKLPIPYIWGPIGGMAKPPIRVTLESGFKNGFLGSVKLIIKSLTSLLRLNTNKRVKQALSESDVVVCATTEYRRFVENAIKKDHHSMLCYLPEICIDKLYDVNYSKFRKDKIELIYIGRLDEGKAPFIILDALSSIKTGRKEFHLNMLGDGPLLNKARRFVESNGLSELVTFCGRQDRSVVFKMLEEAQMMILPTLYDANTTVIWEAMSHAVPTMCLDHCGMHDTVQEGVGVKIPVTSYRGVVNVMRNELQAIADNPECLRAMAENLVEYRKQYTWEQRSLQFEEFYCLAETNFQKYNN